MVRNDDLRVIKTKKNLYEGLIKIMKVKPFENIKVSDICQVSLTNRSTFYDHFNDKYELLDSLIKDLEKELENRLDGINDTTSAKEYYLKMLELFLDHISDNISVYSSIIKNNNNNIAYDMFMNTILSDVTGRLTNYRHYTNLIPVDIVTTFYVSGVVSICLQYIKEPNKYSKDLILSYIGELMPKNIY